MDLRVFITGAGGRLGREIVKYFPGAYAPPHNQLDVRHFRELSSAFALSRPELIIHLAAIADVRVCEEMHQEAWDVNVVGTENVIKLCRESMIPPAVIYCSSPCVFRCETGGYVESSETHPINSYGRTKAAAERVVLGYEKGLVVRTNFVPRARWKYPGAFTDRFGTYLFADEVAFVISQLPRVGMTGIVHVVGSERMSMFEVAKITSPNVRKMAMVDADIDLCRDMSMRSERIRTFQMLRSPRRPANYSRFELFKTSNYSC